MRTLKRKFFSAHKYKFHLSLVKIFHFSSLFFMNLLLLHLFHLIRYILVVCDKKHLGSHFLILFSSPLATGSCAQRENSHPKTFFLRTFIQLLLWEVVCVCVSHFPNFFLYFTHRYLMIYFVECWEKNETMRMKAFFSISQHTEQREERKRWKKSIKVL